MISPANQGDLEAWERELASGIEVLEALEYAEGKAKNLTFAKESYKTIGMAIQDLEIAVSKAALKVGRLKRAKENN